MGGNFIYNGNMTRGYLVKRKCVFFLTLVCILLLAFTSSIFAADSLGDPFDGRRRDEADEDIKAPDNSAHQAPKGGDSEERRSVSVATIRVNIGA